MKFKSIKQYHLKIKLYHAYNITIKYEYNKEEIMKSTFTLYRFENLIQTNLLYVEDIFSKSFFAVSTKSFEKFTGAL